jgi:hypothetical protein
MTRTISLLLLVGGCATINPHYYETMPTAQICHGLMTLPSWNLNQNARWRELERRGASCGTPGEIAAAQRGAEQQLGQSLTTIQQVTTPPRPLVCRTQPAPGGGSVTTCQ